MSQPLQTTPTDDLAALSRYAQDQDAYAFEVLVRRYQGMVLAVCRRQLDNAADAEDAAQETFLKLARKAATVRSGVAGWLHACAVGTARDLARKRATRRKYEHAATPKAAPAREPGWAELEPEIDSAMASLSRKDRQLLAARFLANRPQTELAAEAGVSPPAIHQRIDRAIGRLRKHLRARGVTFSGAGLAAVMGTAGAQAAVPTALTGSLVSVGLAGIGGSPAGAAAPAAAGGAWLQPLLGLGLGAKLAAGAVVGAAALGGIAAGTGHFSAQFSAPAPLTLPAAGANAPARTAEPGPTWLEGDWQLVGMDQTTRWADHVTTRGDMVQVAIPNRYGQGPPMFTLKLRVLETHPQARPPMMKVNVVSADTPPQEIWSQLVGQDLETSYRVDGDIIQFAMVPPGNPRPTRFVIDDPRQQVLLWRGVRRDPPQDAGADPGATMAGGFDPALAGTWKELPALTMSFRDGALLIVNQQAPLFPETQAETVRFVARDAHTFEHEVVLTADPQRGQIGRRDRLLVGLNDPDTLQIATYAPFTPRHGDWPTGFASDPQSGLVVSQWKRATR